MNAAVDLLLYGCCSRNSARSHEQDLGGDDVRVLEHFFGLICLIPNNHLSLRLQISKTKK